MFQKPRCDFADRIYLRDRQAIHEITLNKTRIENSLAIFSFTTSPWKNPNAILFDQSAYVILSGF